MDTYPVPQSFPERSLRDFYIILFRQKWKIIFFFLAVMLLTALATFLLPEIYQSDASLIIRLGRESVSLDPTATTGQIVNVGQARENEIKTELEILKSRDLAEKIVNALGYQAILAGKFLPGQSTQSSQSVGLAGPSSADTAWERDKALGNLMKNLAVDNQKNSNLIAVAYQAESPDLAQAVVAKLIDVFLEKHINVHRTPGSHDFFQLQTEQSNTKLVQTENALKELKNKTGIGSVTEQRTILLKRIGELQGGIEATVSNLAASKSKVQTMGKTLAGLPKNLLRSKFTGYSGNPMDYLQQRLLELQIKEKDLRATMTENSRPVQDIRQQIAEVQALMQQEGATHNQVASLALLNEKANVAELQSKVGAMRGELVSAQNELGKINEAEVKIGQLEREIETQRTNYRNYADKLSQTRIDRALEMEKISNISVVQAASYPVKPIWPRKATNLALGSLLGLLGGLGLAFLAEQMDHSFKTPGEVEVSLQLPVLATIPLFNSQAKGSLGAGVPLLMPGPEQAWGLATDITQFSDLLPAEMLDWMSSAEASHLLAVTSCHLGEGVSTFASGLAVNSVQQTSGRVLLVDTNIDRPSAHLVFGLKRSPGLTDLCDQGLLQENGIKTSTIKNLDILPAGQGKANLARFFESRQFSDLLNLWKREYRFIIFDTPALQEAPWVSRLAGLTDGAVLVVEAERTRREVAQRAKEMLEHNQARVLGVVLNKRQFHIPQWVYRTL
jgi:capsular exopolysaccharide synthesis family protein